MKLSLSRMLCGAIVVGLTWASNHVALAAEDQGTTPALALVEMIFEKQHVPLSIDPETLVELESLTMDRPSPGSTSLDRVLKYLGRHGFVIAPVQFTPNRKVCFLTKRGTAIYCAAIGNLKRGNMRAAREALLVLPTESSEFAMHCVELRVVLDALAQRRRAISEWDLEIRRSVDRWKVGKVGVVTATAAARSAFKNTGSARRLGSDLALAFAESSSARATEEAQKVSSFLDPLLSEARASQQGITERFQRASLADLRSEQAFLLEQVILHFERYQATRRWVTREGLSNSNPSTDVSVPGVATDLKRAILVADAAVETGVALLGEGKEEEAVQQFARAFALDRANPLARIGAGLRKPTPRRASQTESGWRWLP